MLLAVVLNAQSKSDKMYDAFIGKDGVTNFSFSKNMLDAVDLDLGENGDDRNVTGDLYRVRFLTYNPKKGTLSGSDFHKKAVSLLPSRYKKYEDKKGETEDAEIWLLGKRKKFSECHLFFNNDDDNQLQFIVSFYGKFRVDDLDELKKTGKDYAND